MAQTLYKLQDLKDRIMCEMKSWWLHKLLATSDTFFDY